MSDNTYFINVLLSHLLRSNTTICISHELINAMSNNNTYKIKELLDIDTSVCGEHIFIYVLSKCNTDTIKFVFDYYEKKNKKIDIMIQIEHTLLVLITLNKSNILDYLIYLGKHNYNKIIVPLYINNSLEHFSIIKKGIKFYNFPNNNRYIVNNNIIFIKQNNDIMLIQQHDNKIIYNTDYILCIL